MQTEGNIIPDILSYRKLNSPAFWRLFWVNSAHAYRTTKRILFKEIFISKNTNQLKNHGRIDLILISNAPQKKLYKKIKKYLFSFVLFNPLDTNSSSDSLMN